MSVKFELEYPPSVNHYYVRTKKGMAIGKPGRLYRKTSIVNLRQHQNHFTKNQRLAIVINVFPPDKRKRDLDNLLKCCLDSIQYSLVFPHDNQLDLITVIRREPVEGGKLSIWLREC